MTRASWLYCLSGMINICTYMISNNPIWILVAGACFVFAEMSRNEQSR